MADSGWWTGGQRMADGGWRTADSGITINKLNKLNN